MTHLQRFRREKNVEICGVDIWDLMFGLDVPRSAIVVGKRSQTKPNGLLGDLAKEFDYHDLTGKPTDPAEDARGCTREHYRVDQCWWSHYGRSRSLDVAIEHENRPGSYPDELAKLIFVGAALRVVVGYPMKGRNKEIKGVDRALGLAHALKRSARCPSASSGTLALILGPRAMTMKQLSATSRVWRMWTWDLTSAGPWDWDPDSPDLSGNLDHDPPVEAGPHGHDPPAKA